MDLRILGGLRPIHRGRDGHASIKESSYHRELSSDLFTIDCRFLRKRGPLKIECKSICACGSETSALCLRLGVSVRVN